MVTDGGTVRIGSFKPIAQNATELRNKYMSIKLYTMIGCHNCKLVKQFLDDHSIAYDEIDCDKNIDEAISVMKLAGSDVLPILRYNGDNFILGYSKDNLEKLIKLI